MRDEPDAAGFERWLRERCVAQGESDGAHRAMALMIWHEWQLASQLEDGSAWLTMRARSDDREEEGADASQAGVADNAASARRCFGMCTERASARAHDAEPVRASLTVQRVMIPPDSGRIISDAPTDLSDSATRAAKAPSAP